MIEFDIKLTEIFDCFAVCELCNIKSLTREKGKEENNGGGLSLDLIFPQNLTKKIIVSVKLLKNQGKKTE